MIDEQHADGEVIVKSGCPVLPDIPPASARSLSSNPLARSVSRGCVFLVEKVHVTSFNLYFSRGRSLGGLRSFERLLRWGHGLRPGDAESLCSGALGAPLEFIASLKGKTAVEKNRHIRTNMLLTKVNILCVLWGKGISKLDFMFVCNTSCD